MRTKIVRLTFDIKSYVASQTHIIKIMADRKRIVRMTEQGEGNIADFLERTLDDPTKRQEREKDTNDERSTSHEV